MTPPRSALTRERAAGPAAAVQAHVPLKPVWLQIMLSIAIGEGHGYSIRKSVEERTDGKIRLWPTTLYGTLRQIAEAGLIEERQGAEHEPDARGRREFVLTENGRAVLDAETTRLEQLVTLARATAVASR